MLNNQINRPLVPESTAADRTLRRRLGHPAPALSDDLRRLSRASPPRSPRNNRADGWRI